MAELSMRPERPTDGEILSVLVDHYDVPAKDVLAWLARFNGYVAYREYLQTLGAATEQK